MSNDGRITWVRGDARPGPRETIGVLEVQEDGGCRAALAERVEVDGRCHILLARTGWGPKESLATRWWSLVLSDENKVYTVRNGSCGDSLTKEDVPRIKAALESLDLQTRDTMIVVDGDPSAFPWHPRGGGPK